MVKIFKILLVLVLVGVVAYLYSPTARARLEPFVIIAQNKISLVTDMVPWIFPAHACVEPIKYSLARFDTKFNISKTDFLKALTEAESIWEKVAGKQLFTYAPEEANQKSTVKVNLIYDYRQQATDKLESLGITLEDNHASYDALKAKYASIEKQYNSEKAAYEKDVADFNTRNAAYKQQVDYWNTRGGAPEREFEQLNAEQTKLRNEAAQLQTRQVRLNSEVDEINAVVVAINRLATLLNLAVEQYNTIGEARGETFEAGLYESNSAGKTVNIYEFKDREKLVRVLTHELGHALGLDHVSDPEAIMYSFNRSSKFVATNADITALKTLCRIN